MHQFSASKEQKYLLALKKDKAGDRRGAMRLFRELARRGEAMAQHALAYTLETQVNSARKEAIHWYKRAAHNGFPAAAWNLALLHARHGQLRWQMHWLKVCLRIDRRGTLEDLNDHIDALIESGNFGAARPFAELAAKSGERQALRKLRQLEGKIGRR